MTPQDISGLIAEELALGNARSFGHDADLAKCLVEPTKVRFEDGFKDGGQMDLWIVFKEDPDTESGYLVVYDDKERKFGLAMCGIHKSVFLGFHGSFMKTLDAM